MPVTLIDVYAGMGIDIHQVYGSTADYVMIDSLPRNAAGKVQKHVIRQTLKLG